MQDKQEVIDYATLSEIEFMQTINAKVSRHLGNLQNTIAMMRTGHFIEAYGRLMGSIEGLTFLRKIIEIRVSAITEKTNESDQNPKL